MNNMNACKEFIQLIRKVSYKDVYIILEVGVMPQLTKYVSIIEDIQFKDGSYHTYYGEVKKCINSFLCYWKYVVDDVIQEADKCTNVIDKDELLILMDRTIDIHQVRQIDFGKSFLPVQSPIEKEVCNKMEELYNVHMEKLYDLKQKIEQLDKQEKVDDFVKDHFKITIKGTGELFDTAHVYLSLMLADRVNNIRISLEEILLRMRNNLRDIKARSEETLNCLLGQLYEKNKELLHISRQYRKCSIDYAETGHGIERIRAKIEKYSFEPPITRLEEEVAYWQDRVEDFQKTTAGLLRLKKEHEEVIKQEEIYNTLKTSELPGSRKQCWLNMGENFTERKKYLEDKIIEASKLLMTFFSVRGTDRIIYTDNIGHYYVDEFNHQVYVFNYGLDIYHRNCEGEFKEVSDKNCYYYDTYGRYILGENGEKVYQCAPCTSQYQLTSSNLLQKTTKDCGHSEKLNQKCCLLVKDLANFGEVVPHIDNIDIKNSLPAETARYLWDSFGAVLPPALHDVGTVRTKNPIQRLAHCLLLHKYNKTKAEFREKEKEAAEYRANVFKERKEKAMAASRAWKAKQVRRRTPEESDDADHAAAYDALAFTHHTYYYE